MIRKSLQFAAFSLVEVTIAMGIFAFTISTLVGSLSVGLLSIHDSMSDSAIANISQQIRSAFQQVSFNVSNPASIQKLVDANYYYSLEGDPTDEAHAYYKAVLSATAAEAASTVYSTANARMVTVQLVYPHGAASQHQKSSWLSILATKQSAD